MPDGATTRPLIGGRGEGGLGHAHPALGVVDGEVAPDAGFGSRGEVGLVVLAPRRRGPGSQFYP